MKKKLFLLLAMLALVVCMLAISVSAAEPDTTGECVTLDDGTVCPLWDTDGNPLIWYVTATDPDTDAKTYAYVDATSSAVTYNGGYSSTTDGVRWYQLSKITITVDGTAYEKATFAVLNLQSENVKVTTGSNVGQHVTAFAAVFTGATNLEYAYLPLDTVTLNKENFKNCTALKYVNVDKLTELRKIGSQDFNIGSVQNFFAGEKLDLSNTKITIIDTNGFACCAATEIVLPSTLTTVNSDAFKNCKYATKITFNGTLTSLNTSNLFNGCNDLEEIAGFNIPAGTTSIGNYAFRYCHKLKDAGDFIVNGIMTLPEGIATINQFAFSECKAITAVIFPSTINTINQQGFSYMSSLAVIDFNAKDAAVKAAIVAGESYTPLTFGNCGHFRNAGELYAVSLPEGVEEVGNRLFVECPKLTAVYLPNSVVRMHSDGEGKGLLCNSTLAYFVQDSFSVSAAIVDSTVDTTKIVLPEKPEVYFMPTSLEYFKGHIYSNDTYSNATMFKNCTSLNSVIVFPENFTSMKTMKAFMDMGSESSPKTLVFLADMEEFVISREAKYVSYVFANENDTCFEDLGILRTSAASDDKNSYAYFCSTGTRYDLNASGRVSSGTDATTEANISSIATTIEAIEATASTESFQHFVNPNATVVTEVGCTTDGATSYYCFCGDFINSVVDEEATGHNEGSPVVDIYYPTFIVMGYAVHECTDCQERFNAEEATYAPIFVSKGYSCTVYDGMISIVQGFDVNREALAAYTAIDGNTISYGVVATSVNKVADGNIDVVNNVDGVTAIDFTTADKAEFTRFEIKVADIAEANWDTGLYACAYVIADGAVSFISENASTATATAKTAATILQENPV